MHPALLSSLVLIALRVCVPVDCAPTPQPQSNTTTTTAAGAGGGGGHTNTSKSYYSMWRKLRRPLLSVSDSRTGSLVSITDVRKRQFVCIDSEGELFHSRQGDIEDCLFLRLWWDVSHHRDVYIANGGQVVTLGTGPTTSLFGYHEQPINLTERLGGPRVKRRRRSEEVNPSDPLRTDLSHTAKVKEADHAQPDQDQPGAVSKETITSCDDPLRVLRPNGAISPLKTNIAERAGQD